MDPYGDHNRKIVSPLDKITSERKIGETTRPISSEIVGVKEETHEEPDEKVRQKSLLLSIILSDLRKQLIKSVAIFLFFFIVVFSTINFWFPYVTRGHELVILGPLEVVKFYMSISLHLRLVYRCRFFAIFFGNL